MKRRMVLLAGLSLAVAVPGWAEAHHPYLLQLSLNFLIVAVLALSWDILARTGQLSLAHAAFFGLGAYTSALLALQAGWPLLLTMAAGSVLAILTAAGLGLVTLRLRGIYFAIATLAFSEMLRVVVKQVPFTGAASGLVVPPLLPGRLFAQYLVVLGMLALAVAVSWALNRSRWAFAFTAIRTNETVAAVMGVDVVRFKVAAFTISAGFAGLAGAYFAHIFLFINPFEVFSLAVSVSALVASIFGGLYTTAGPVVGAVTLRIAEQILEDRIGPGYPVIYGLVLAVAILYMPRGLLGVWTQRFGRPQPIGSPHPRPAAAGGTLATVPDAGRSGGKPLLVLQGVTKRFGGLVAVDDLSLEVRSGEILALIGPNGAGKSTTFNLISGLFPPDRGCILFDGRDITRASPVYRTHLGIGRTFQVMQPFHDMTVLENVMVGGLFGHAVQKSLAVARADAEAVCRLVGIDHLLHRTATDLGVADLKRLEVARALATHPRLLLLDEVMAGLTPAEAAQVAAMIRRVRDSGITILLIDHVMRSVRDVADRVVVLNFGRKIAEGSFAEVARSPDVIEAYLGEEGAADV